MNPEPLVSVLMTAYNRELYISEAIVSILNQTYRNFELIIVDDASVDSTREIVKHYLQHDSRIKFYCNESNIGQFKNRSRAASYAKGEFIIFCDSDDTFNYDALEYIVNSFTLNPDAQHSSIYYGGNNAPFLMSSEVAIRTHFLKKNILYCGPSAFAFKKDFYNKMKGYPDKYDVAGDTYFNIKTTSNSPILFLPYRYLNYRIHQGQEINNTYSYIYNGYRYFDDVLKLPELPLNNNDIKFLYRKNKRRFIVNACKYLFKIRSIKKTINLFSLAGFTFRDFLIGVFHI